MSPLDILLTRLENVRQYGGGYRAKCPAHDGKSTTSLSISDKGDRFLIHCFGGCDPASVMAAVGLELADLYTDSRLSMDAPERRAWKRRTRHMSEWRAAISVLALEASVVWLAGLHMLKGDPVDDDFWLRLDSAVNRILEVKEMFNV